MAMPVNYEPEVHRSCLGQDGEQVAPSDGTVTADRELGNESDNLG